MSNLFLRGLDAAVADPFLAEEMPADHEARQPARRHRAVRLVFQMIALLRAVAPAAQGIVDVMKQSASHE